MPRLADVYVPGQSWLHALDPRTKLLLVVSLLSLLLMFRNLWLTLGMLVLVHGLHRSARIPRQDIVNAWKAVLPVSLLMGTLWVVFYPSGTPILRIGSLQITGLSVAQGLVLAVRLIAMSLAVLIWLFTTDYPSIVRGLVKLGLPFEWGFALALALRYIPTLHETYGAISEAQQARGLDAFQGTGVHRVRTTFPILIAMVISSLRASENLAVALEARAFGAHGVRRTYLRDIRFRRADYLWSALIVTGWLVLTYLNLQSGFGTHAIQLR